MLRGYMHLSEKIYSCAVFPSDFKLRNITLCPREKRRDWIALQNLFIWVCDLMIAP